MSRTLTYGVLAWSGALLLAGTGWFAWSLPATASRRSRASAPLAHRVAPWQWLFDHAAPPSSGRVLGAWLIGATLTLFLAWMAVVGLAWRRPARSMLRAVLLLVALTTAISVLALPNKTSDVYDYALFGRVVSVHSGQAYQDVPNDYPDDAIAPYGSGQYTGRPDNKLPAWTIVAAGTTAVTGDGPIANLMSFRLLLGGANLLTCLLIAWTLGKRQPAAQAAGVAIFGLNPITIVYGPEKTDSLMALLVVAGLALVVAGHRYVATVAVTASMLVKLITAPVLLLVVAMPLGRSGTDRDAPTDEHARSALLGPTLGRALVALGTVVLVYLPFTPPGDLFSLPGRHLSGADRASVIPGLHSTALGLSGLGLMWITAMAWRRRHPDRAAQTEAVLRSSAIVLIVFSLILTRPGLPWYLISALAGVALVPSVVAVVTVGMLSFASFLLGIWDAVGTPDHPLPTFDVARPVTYLGAAAVALAVVVLLRRSARPREPGTDPISSTAPGHGRREQAAVAEGTPNSSEGAAGGRPPDELVLVVPEGRSVEDGAG